MKATLSTSPRTPSSVEGPEPTRLQQAELADYQRSVRIIADMVPQIVWATRPDGYFDYFNQRWYELTGMPEGSTDGDAWLPLCHPDDQDRLWATWRHVLATGKSHEAEFRLRHKSGEYRWVLARALPLRNNQGEIERWFGTSTDIHDLKRTQQALAESEEFTSRLLSSLNDCVAVLDLDGRLRFMNEGGRRVMEVGNFRWIDGSYWPNVWTDPAAPVQAAMESATAGRSTRFESFCPTLAGTPKWWDVVVTPMKSRDGTPERLLWISRDITERKRAEQSIAEMAERYSLAARATNDAIWDWDFATDHIVWNEAVQNAFGYAPEEIDPSSRWWKERIHPDDRERVVKGIYAVIDGPGSHWADEYSFQLADGSYAMIVDRGYVLRDENGRAVRMTGVLFDITERKRHEEQQELVNRELHHRVKNTLATVQALISSTARSAQTVGEFHQAVTERIISLAKTHTLLIENARDRAALGDIMRSELEAYDDGSGQRIRLSGPEVLLPSEIAVVFGMALHELATNAAKHGALSLPTGQIDVSWSLEQQTSGRKLTLHWRERGGPLVTKPEQEGFGSMLLQSCLGRQLGGQIEMIFAPSGLEVRISAALPPPRMS